MSVVGLRLGLTRGGGGGDRETITSATSPRRIACNSPGSASGKESNAHGPLHRSMGNSLFGRFYKADAVAVSPARSAICARRRMASGRTGVVGASDLGQTVDGRQAATPRRLILTRVFLKGIAPNGGEHEGRRRDRAGTASRVLDVAARVLDLIAIAAGFYGGCGAQHHRGVHDRTSQEASGERAHGALVPASESAPPSTALESRHRLERARTARRAASVPGYSRSSRS